MSLICLDTFLGVCIDSARGTVLTLFGHRRKLAPEINLLLAKRLYVFNVSEKTVPTSAQSKATQKLTNLDQKTKQMLCGEDSGALQTKGLLWQHISDIQGKCANHLLPECILLYTLVMEVVLFWVIGEGGSVCDTIRGVQIRDGAVYIFIRFLLGTGRLTIARGIN